MSEQIIKGPSTYEKRKKHNKPNFSLIRLLDQWRRTYLSLGWWITLMQYFLPHIPTNFYWCSRSQSIHANRERSKRFLVVWLGENRWNHLIGWNQVSKLQGERRLGARVFALRMSFYIHWHGSFKEKSTIYGIWRFTRRANLWHRVIRRIYGSYYNSWNIECQKLVQMVAPLSPEAYQTDLFFLPLNFLVFLTFLLVTRLISFSRKILGEEISPASSTPLLSICPLS